MVQSRCWLAIIFSVLVMNNSIAAVNDSSVKISWSYTGSTAPIFWARLSKQFAMCGEGKVQSPINIPKKKLIKANHSLSLHYHSAPLVMMDDGVTDLTLGTDHALVNMGHTLQLNFHPDAKETLDYDGHTYQLIQFHFHSPSENQLQGRSYPLELHFVHQGEAGRVMVVGVFVVSGNYNRVLQKLIDNAPEESGTEYRVPRQTINPVLLMPKKRDFYSFSGSLTTPPCTEGLEWVVMHNMITASPAQIVKLRRIIGGSNARSVQPLHYRMISYSTETPS